MLTRHYFSYFFFSFAPSCPSFFSGSFNAQDCFCAQNELVFSQQLAAMTKPQLLHQIKKEREKEDAKMGGEYIHVRTMRCLDTVQVGLTIYREHAGAA